MLEESVYELVVKQLRQHQNTMEDKFIVCLSRATKNFAPLADRWGVVSAYLLGRVVSRGGWLCPSACREGSWGVVTTCLPGTVLVGVSAPPLTGPARQVHEQRALPAAEVPRRDEDAVSGGGAVSCGGDP